MRDSLNTSIGDPSLSISDLDSKFIVLDVLLHPLLALTCFMYEKSSCTVDSVISEYLGKNLDVSVVAIIVYIIIENLSIFEHKVIWDSIFVHKIMLKTN